MKKLICIIALLALTLGVFSGCHGAQERIAYVTPEEFDASRNYEITFWAKNDSNQTQINIYRKAIEDFQKIYPNITVKLRLYSNYGDIYKDVITNISTNTTPNVCITYPDHIATYLSGENIVVPLDDLMVNPKYGLGGSEVKFDAPTKDEIIPKFLKECSLGGYTYALPYMRSTEACYINKDMVEKLGYTLPEKLTWDFIWEVSEAATAKNPDGTYAVNGQTVMLPFIYKSTDNMMIQILKQLDAGFSTPAGDVQIFNEDTKAFLYTAAQHAKTGAFSTFKISGYPGNYLNAGQCIFAIDSTAGATWMGAHAPQKDVAEDKVVDFETVVMPIPQFDTENPQMISQGPSMCVFNKEDPQEVLASWLFAQFMLTNEVQIAYSQTEGYVPVTSKAQQSEVYQDYLSRCGEDNDLYYDVKIKAAQLLLDNTENSFITPVFNGSASLRDAAGQLIESTVNSVQRKDTIDEAYMQKLFSTISSLYRLDQIQTSNNHRAEFDALPTGSVILLSSLAGVWAIIGLSIFCTKIKRKKQKN